MLNYNMMQKKTSYHIKNMGHPDKNDLDNAKAFFKELEKGK